MDIFNRILFTYRRRGAIGFLRLLLKNTVQHPRKLLTGRYFRQSSQVTSEFDAIHGTDTEQVREIYDMDIPADRWRDAVRYQPSPHNLAKKLIHGLNIDCSKYTFLDYGAGKGRVLLIAAELPFHAVIGIELSAELCATATANIDMVGPATLKAREIRCARADATSFALPDTSLVCYFYNPFGENVLQAVADSLAASLDASPPPAATSTSPTRGQVKVLRVR